MSVAELDPGGGEREVGAPLIEGRGLTRVFGVRRGVFAPRRTLRAVDGVSLVVHEGETVALVGESGSGKSTLGRLLLGVLAPSDGDVLYEGEDVSRLQGAAWRRFRREVQVVFQDTGASLNPRRSVGSSVGLPLRHNLGRSAAQARAGAAELLARVGLPPETFLERRPHELSGGQRQRVGIARALASQPRFVVADEPVSALDVSIRAGILKLLSEVQGERGIAYLFITHDLGVVRAIASRAVVLYLGAVMESGPVSALFSTPAHPYTRALLAATPVPDPTRRRTAEQQGARGDPPSPIDPPPGCRFHTRCPLVQDICRTTVPPLVTFPDGVVSACHYATDVRQLPRPGAVAAVSGVSGE